MAFNMKGSPAKMGRIQGTAGHASALKMKAEADAAASALKQTVDGVNLKTSLGGKIKSLPSLFPGGKSYGEAKAEQRASGNVSNKTKKALVEAQTTKKTKAKKNAKMSNENWKKGQDKAKSEGNDLDALVKSRKGLKKGTPEYNKVQNQINSSLGNKKRHGVESSTETKGRKTTTTTSTPSEGTTKDSVKVDRKGNVKKLKSVTEDGVNKSKTVQKVKDGKVTKVKTKSRKDIDGDGKIDRKTRTRTKLTTEGKVKADKNVVREGGRRTVTKTDRDGNTTTKSRRTLKGFLTGKGKKKKVDSPADMNDGASHGKSRKGKNKSKPSTLPTGY